MKVNDSSCQCKQAISLNDGMRIQRDVLKKRLRQPMQRMASACAYTDMSANALEMVLVNARTEFSDFKQLFVLNDEFVQITKSITPDNVDAVYQGCDRKSRPQTVNILGKTEFNISSAYISQHRHRPSLTAMTTIRTAKGSLLGYLGADFDLRELPHIEQCYREPDNWHQLKGDPVIRGGLFSQQRATSIMDDNIDDALDTIQELITECGVYHVDTHFSRSRATVWHSDDPFTYHLLSINELTSPDILLAYPQRPYIERAQIPADEIRSILEIFKELRFADDNIYLRFASINIVNAMVCLNFSCDGTHYMRFDEFLNKDIDFWFGKLGGLQLN